MRHHHHQRTLQVKQHLLPLMPLSYQHTNQSQDRIQLIQRPIGFYPDIVFIYTLSAMNIRFPLISSASVYFHMIIIYFSIPNLSIIYLTG